MRRRKEKEFEQSVSFVSLERVPGDGALGQFYRPVQPVVPSPTACPSGMVWDPALAKCVSVKKNLVVCHNISVAINSLTAARNALVADLATAQQALTACQNSVCEANYVLYLTQRIYDFKALISSVDAQLVQAKAMLVQAGCWSG